MTENPADRRPASPALAPVPVATVAAATGGLADLFPGEVEVKEDIIPSTPGARTPPRTRTREAPAEEPGQPSPGGPGGYDEETWESIELEYRTGVKTLRQLADEYGITGGPEVIGRKARRHGWVRDLSQKVRSRARAELARLAGTEAGNGVLPKSKQDPRAEAAAIEAAAGEQVQIVLRHRKFLSRLFVAMEPILTKLEVMGRHPKRLGKIEMLRAAAQTADALARLTARAIPLERQAYNIDAEKGPATEAAAIEARAQRYAARKRASPDDPNKVERAMAMLAAADQAKAAGAVRTIEERAREAAQDLDRTGGAGA